MLRRIDRPLALRFPIEWNLEVLVFLEEGTPKFSGKNPRSKDEKEQETHPTYDAGSGNLTRAGLKGLGGTLSGGEGKVFTSIAGT